MDKKKATTKRMTKATATRELVDRVCGKAINAPDVETDLFESMVEKAKGGIENPQALGFIAGMWLGSTAVARRWVERNPASALVYVAGIKNTEKLLKSKLA